MATILRLHGWGANTSEGGIGALTTNDADDGTYAALNDAALVISGGPGGVERTGLAGSGRGPGRPDGSDQHP